MIDKKIEISNNINNSQKEEANKIIDKPSILSETKSDSMINISLEKINQSQTNNSIIISENKILKEEYDEEEEDEDEEIDEDAELSLEVKEQIEKMVEANFKEEYDKLNKEYNDKIEEIINEREALSDKYEIIKAKYDALEEYIKSYCKRNNIDYNSLIQDG